MRTNFDHSNIMAIAITIHENRLKRTIWLLFGSLLLFLLGLLPDFVEKWYSLGFYPLFANFLRILTGWIPFSFGDLLYIGFGVWLFVLLRKGIGVIFNKKITTDLIIHLLGNVIRFFSWIYILFKLFWGMNYSRLGIEQQLGIKKYQYTKDDITLLTKQLIKQTNVLRRAFQDSTLPQYSLDLLKLEAIKSYHLANAKHSFLAYNNLSVKESLFTPLANYIGFTGYYNPFTGEAQLRTDVPNVLTPYITCHEMAHQLGYANESEANFVGYLAASNSNNLYFKYSVYLDLLGYALTQQFILYARDSSYKAFEDIVKYNKSNIDTLVKKDRKEIRQFFITRKNKISPISADLYDQYLKMNKQLAGINSYDEVIGWMIAYQKKYKKL